MSEGEGYDWDHAAGVGRLCSDTASAGSGDDHCDPVRGYPLAAWGAEIPDAVAAQRCRIVRFVSRRECRKLAVGGDQASRYPPVLALASDGASLSAVARS